MNDSAVVVDLQLMMHQQTRVNGLNRRIFLMKVLRANKEDRHMILSSLTAAPDNANVAFHWQHAGDENEEEADRLNLVNNSMV